MNKPRLSLCLLLTVCSFLPTYADKLGLWSGAELTQDIGATGLSADVDLGFRLGNDFKNVDRWSVGVGLGYDLTSFLKVSAGYIFLYNYQPSSREEKYDGTNWKGYNVENSYWRPKNRFRVDLKGSVDVGRFSFSLRERYQLTGYNPRGYRKDKYRYNKTVYEDGTIKYTLKDGYPEGEQDTKKHKTKQYLRSCAKVEYNIPHCPVNPYASFELYDNLAEGFAIDKRRYSVGVDWKIKKGQHLTVGYLYNNGNADEEEGDIHVIDISYSIKGLFSKK